MQDNTTPIIISTARILLQQVFIKTERKLQLNESTYRNWILFIGSKHWSWNHGYANTKCKYNILLFDRYNHNVAIRSCLTWHTLSYSLHHLLNPTRLIYLLLTFRPDIILCAFISIFSHKFMNSSRTARSVWIWDGSQVLVLDSV